jgi:1,4-alpha-glucan branching enzyme
MGSEFGQWAEWSHDESLEWHLLQHDSHRGIQKWISDLNRAYRAERALHELDCDPAGFEWIDGSDSEQSMVSFMRKSQGGDQIIACVFNFTPVPRHNYRVGVPRGGYWQEILNSDSESYGGTGFGNLGGAEAEQITSHGRPLSLNLIVPPLGVVFLKNG